LAQTLREQGFQHVRALQGGLDAWVDARVDARLPVERKQQAA
jgi:rhodanese-related sulfurtransferase